MPVGNEYGIKLYHIIPARRKWAGAGAAAYVGPKPLNNLKTMVIRHKHLLNAMLSIVFKNNPPNQQLLPRALYISFWLKLYMSRLKKE